jgi:hypothetical protein
MKTGKSLSQLAVEIERQQESRKDYVAATRQLRALPVSTDGDIVFEIPTEGRLEALDLRDLAHRQVGTHCNIPAPYYDRCRAKAPTLLASNINHWFQAEPCNRMVRTLDGRVRAFLSDRYRPLENADLAEAVLPVLGEQTQLEVVSCEITERRLYIKAVDRACVRDVDGRHIIDGRSVEYDHVSPALTISNSEVGAGALSVETGLFKHGCRNMAMFREKSLRKYHIGGKHELGEGLVALLSDRTRRLSDAATWAQVADVVRGALNPEAFDEALVGVREMTQQQIGGDVVKVVNLAARHFTMTEKEGKSVLKHLIEGGDLSRYGLFNAVTRTAEDLDDYDRATDFERIGGEIIELAANDWKRIAEAA